MVSMELFNEQEYGALIQMVQAAIEKEPPFTARVIWLWTLEDKLVEAKERMVNHAIG